MSHIIGTFEQVSFPEFNSDPVRAKIDTGAYSGALHCQDIKEIDLEDGKVLSFLPLGGHEVVQKDDFLIKYVRSSNGKRQKRYFIATEILVQGKPYEIMLSLADRSEMKWPVLIGRRFLKHNNFLIDPSRAYGYREQTARK